jgi:hypothetical protein
VRREFIDDPLYGRSDLGRLSERAERFGLLLSRAHAVAVAQGGKPVEETDPATRHVQSGSSGGPTTRYDGRQLIVSRCSTR